MVQTTFTKQKRELAKANTWIERLRAHETRTITYNSDKVKQGEVRDNYVDYAPEEVARNVLQIVTDIVNQHGARQQANAKNTGRFSWQGITADLTVPQLRTLLNAHSILNDLVKKLPRRNPKLVPNTTLEGRPAFMHRMQEHRERKTRTVPYEEEASTRVRTYEENYDVITHYSQAVEIDYGLDVRLINKLSEMVTDLGTAIQVAIDEANAKGHQEDKLLAEVIANLEKIFLQTIDTRP